MNTATTYAGSLLASVRRVRVWTAAAAIVVASGAAHALAPAVGAASAATQDIRDIRPPFHFSPEWLWLIGILSWCLLVLLAAVFWSWWRRRARARRMAAHELALARLREAQALMSPDQARAFSIAVSDIVRTYIEQRFDIRAAHRTSSEFLHDCVSQADGLLAPHRQILESFLRHCDLAKFARWVLSVPEMEDMLASAVDFVIETAQCSPGPADRATHAANYGGPFAEAEATAP